MSSCQKLAGHLAGKVIMSGDAVSVRFPHAGALYRARAAGTAHHKSAGKATGFAISGAVLNDVVVAVLVLVDVCAHLRRDRCCCSGVATVDEAPGRRGGLSQRSCKDRGKYVCVARHERGCASKLVA